jgi:hypothetical protein
MLLPIAHYPVNWVDGMKISRRHFTEFEEYVTDSLRDVNAVRLTDYSYGLLPAHSRQPESLEMLITYDYTRQINVKLITCRAVTPDGNRIEIIKDGYFVYSVSLDKFIEDKSIVPDKDQYIDVVLSVNPFQRVPTGQPDVHEIPPRHPFTHPLYAISLVPTNQISHPSFKSSHLIIGKLFFTNGEIKPVPTFIPPCMSLSSHQQLLDWYDDFEKLLNNIRESCTRIIHKVKQKNQKNNLAESTYYLVEKFLFKLNESIPYFEWVVAKQPPVAFTDYLTGFIHNINTSLSLLLDKDREELLSYFGEWTDLTPGVLESKIHGVLNYRYNHLDINTGFAGLHGFYALLAGLLSKLSQLEYIGKRKGTEVFIKEATFIEAKPAPVEKPKSRFSPL